MKIEKLHIENIRRFDRPLCQGEVGMQTRRWRDHAGRNYRCQLKALYSVDGKLLCERHAGDAALKFLLEAFHGW